ncbi:inositol monophosphatase family protein (plasmid) [Aminobacter sp. BA135]|uniref:inositol monophosphatase family protein n=1 Tax=Aminobacter sp. BA135 TaxID=537596 RepID=UPI003D7B6CAB
MTTNLRYYAALGIAHEAADLALGYFQNRDKLDVSIKGAQDWLTVADGAVEALIRARLGELFPEDSILGEEMGGAYSDCLWLIDPIDGTANFAHGDPNWCVSIAFLSRGEPEIGIILAPALDQTFTARSGEGAFLNGSAIRVSAQSDISKAAIECGWSARVPAGRYLSLIERGISAGASIKRMGSGALGICRVATATSDGFIELHINCWDVGAAILIAREAGAACNDYFSGNAINDGNPVLCCVPPLASALGEVAGIDI